MDLRVVDLLQVSTLQPTNARAISGIVATVRPLPERRHHIALLFPEPTVYLPRTGVARLWHPPERHRIGLV